MSIGSANLGEALLWIGVYVAGFLLLTALAVWIARRRGSRTIVIDATLAVAQVWLALMGLALVFVVVRGVTSDEIWFAELPATLNWPTQPACGEAPAGGAPTLLCASVDSVGATIAHLGIGTRIVLALGDLLGLVVAAVPAVLVIIVCRQMLKGAPFAQLAARAFFVAAIVVLVAGIGAELTTSIGRSLAASAALPPPGGGELTATGTFRLTAPLWPVGAALVLGALGAIFRHGAVLQRETEGLV
ncbi:hypothetical protein [Microbacterium terricola]|uniref:hypothetical protein n=1 Tax=Microbacterium terricola TaxID=344163 RepID=UPI0021E9908C|nr:hypothetical protein [Microbacterium terricola]UYK39695.1 hypothetical protein OAU46_13485 [Microbacterium terricola]